MEILLEYERLDNNVFYIPLKHTADEFKWVLEMALGYDFDCSEGYVGSEFTFRVVEKPDGFYRTLDGDL